MGYIDSGTPLQCPQCKSDNIHIRTGEANDEGIYDSDENGFDSHDPAICGDCNYKDNASDFAM